MVLEQGAHIGHGAVVHGAQIGRNVLIGMNAVVMDNVTIGENCIIEENTSIGPNTSIGNNVKISKSNIQDSIIMENCEIMIDIKIKNSIISANSKIYPAENEEKIFLLGEGTNIKI